MQEMKHSTRSVRCESPFCQLAENASSKEFGIPEEGQAFVIVSKFMKKKSFSKVSTAILPSIPKPSVLDGKDPQTKTLREFCLVVSPWSRPNHRVHHRLQRKHLCLTKFPVPFPDGLEKTILFSFFLVLLDN